MEGNSITVNAAVSQYLFISAQLRSAEVTLGKLGPPLTLRTASVKLFVPPSVLVV